MTDPTAMKQATDTIDSLIRDPRRGLPEDLFLLASRITPMVNVDLLIKNDEGQTLLTWRDDGYWMPGWHIPGGIIRYQESMAERIHAVARTELGAEVAFEPAPLAIKEIINPFRRVRGHFISFLYQCSLKSGPDHKRQSRSGEPQINQWMWHGTCPRNIIPVHEMYREFMEGPVSCRRESRPAVATPIQQWVVADGR
jgi:ADP-ribose pyrophosphatase YjhB (NUDIX family)